MIPETMFFSRTTYLDKVVETHLIEPYYVPYDPNDESEGGFWVNAVDYEVGKNGEMIDIDHSTISTW